MFNDIDKKLRLTAPFNLLSGIFFCIVTSKYAKIVLEYDRNGEPIKFYPTSKLTLLMIILFAVSLVVSALSFWVYLALKSGKNKPFSALKGAANALRGIAKALLILAIPAVIIFEYWTFFNITSSNPIIHAVTYAIIMLVPFSVMVYSFCCLVYGLGNAADNFGDAKYVENSKLFGIEPLYKEDEERKVCPSCGTRTDRKTCPNCGAKVN